MVVVPQEIRSGELMPNGTAEERLAAIVHAAQDAIFEVDKSGRIAMWNPAAERLFGYSADEAVGLPVAALVPPDRKEEAQRARDAARTGNVPPPFETVRRAKDGTLIPVSVVVSPVRSPAGEPRSAAVVIRDLRPVAATRAQLAAREARFRALVERAGEMFFICTPDAVISYVSPRERTPGGREPQDLVGMSVFALVHEDDKPFMRAAFAAFTATPGAHERVLVRGLDVTGGTRWYHLLATNLVDDPAVGGIVLVAQDVTEQKATADELALYARFDRLTELPTRTALPGELAGLRTRCPGPTALAVVEVEGVRAVQREAGHVAADSARRAVAERIKGAVADEDLVVRLGAETFAVARGGVADEGSARRLGEDVGGAVGEPVAVQGGMRTLAASVGVALSEDADADVMVRDADLARFEAKARGARVEVFTPALRRAVSDRLDLITTLRKGLSEDALRIEFQPAVRLRDGVAVGAEALVRWHAPDGSVREPDAFLPAATANGLMPAVGEWVLRHACAAAATWTADPLPYVSVNVSARELEDDAIVDAVSYALRSSGIAPERLVLEVADTALPVRPESFAGALESLAALGVRIAFDGAGAGSLVYLKRLPVSMLKIGREFVSGLGMHDDDDAIVASLLNLSAAIGVDAVAVGVETEEQRALLAQLGCGVAQGFLLGRPHAEPRWHGAPTAAPGRARRPSRRAPSLDPVVVARIRALMREGASLYTIAAALNAEHLAHPEERRWHPRAVAHAIATAPELTGPRERWTVL